MKFPKYPSIPLIKYRPEIFSVKEVVATEKLHGSTFRVGFPMGMASTDDVVYGSHETVYVHGSHEFFPLGRAVQWFSEKPELLAKMWETIKSYGFSDATVFGEAFGPGIKAKGIKYSTGQDMLFRAFDIMVGENFLTYDLFCEVIDKMGLPRVHEVWRGDPTIAAFDSLLEVPSREATLNGITDASNLAEGVVIRSNPLLRTVFGEWLIVKHKSKKFSEVAEAESTPKTREASPADTFAATYVTEGRILNALARVQARRLSLKNDMTDIPVLLKELLLDLQKECMPEWKALDCPEKAIQGAVSRVLSPQYRQVLASHE